jgi:hypothetical protein
MGKKDFLIVLTYSVLQPPTPELQAPVLSRYIAQRNMDVRAVHNALSSYSQSLSSSSIEVATLPDRIVFKGCSESSVFRFSRESLCLSAPTWIRTSSKSAEGDGQQLLGSLG